MAKTKVFAGLLSIFATSLGHAAQSSAGSGEIAIYSELAGTDVIAQNGSTGAGFLTQDFDTNDREDAGSFTRAGADITLNRAGHYLAIYNSRFDGTAETTTEQRVEVQSYLTLGGTPLASGWSQGFIRRQQNQRETITSGMAIIEAAASDVLQLRSFRTDTTGVGTVTRFPGASGIQLIKLDEVNMSYARLSLASNQAGPTTAAQVKVAYDTTDELDAGFTHASAGDLTLVDGGKYLVIANTYAGPSNNRTSLVQRLTLDGAEVDSSRTTVYLRNAQSANEGAASIGMIIEATAGQVLSVTGSLDVNNPTVNYIGGRCALTVIKLPSLAAGTAAADPDYIRLRHTVDQNVNAATDTPLIFGTQDELDSAFSHTGGTSAVTVNTDGDYLFLSSIYDETDTVARSFYNQGWSTNGGLRSALGHSGRYARSTGGDDEFGNSSGFIGSGLVATNTVEMVSSALGNGGAHQANRIGLQGVRLASLFTTTAGVEFIVDPLALSVTEGGSSQSYTLTIGQAPTSPVEVTITSDADTEVSLDNVSFASSQTHSFTAGGESITVFVSAVDDALIEGPGEAASITHAITTSADPAYVVGLPINSIDVTVDDNDVVPVDAIDDSSVSNANEDIPDTEALIGGSVLGNDTDGLNNFVTSADSVSTMGAAVSVASDGTFTYDPTGSAALQMLPVGGSVVDTFTYTAEDADGNTDTATVSITVDGANDAVEVVSDFLNDGPLENGTFNNTQDLTQNDGIYRRVATTYNFPPGSDLRLLPGKTVTQSPTQAAPPGGGVPERAFDGNVETFTHTVSNNNTVDHVWQVDFGQDVSLENVTLFNRTTNQDRFRDITVTVLDGVGAEVFNSGLLNPTTVPVTIVTSLFVNFGGPITGRTLVVTRTPDLTDIVSNGSILSLGEVTVIGSVVGPQVQVDDNLLLNYEANQSANVGRWENRGSRGGSRMDWLFTDVTLDSSPGSARAGISAAYEWDNAADQAAYNNGGASVHDIIPGTDTADATFEFWVKPDNTSSVMTLFETGGGTGFGVIINNGVLEAATELDGGTQNGSYVSYDLVSDPLGLVGNDPTTEFNQYVAAIDIGGGGIALYVNGVKVDETTSGTTADWDGGDPSGLGEFRGANHGGFANGAAGGTYDGPFLGQMAIMRLYDGLLTPPQVLQNFKAVDVGTDLDGDAISATGVLDGTGSFVANGGQATLASGALVTMNNATGGFDYDPNGVFSLLPGQVATDTFAYRVTDGNGTTADANVTLNITGVIDAFDDNLVAQDQQVATFFANALVGNDEDLPTAANPYLDLRPDNLSGSIWTNIGSSGASRNGTAVSSVSAQELESNFGALGAAATLGTVATLDPISAADATLEVWFKPDPGQVGKKTIFETGGNGTGFSLVFDPATNGVIATLDGGDDVAQAVVAVVPGVVLNDFNQVFVVFDRDGGAEVGVATGIFEDIMSVTLNNDPTTAFDATVDATIVDPEGDANDWSGTDGSGINRVQGTSARNENFAGMAGAVAIVRAYARILTPVEMALNYDSAVQAITAVSSPTVTEGVPVTLNADGSVTVDYSAISLAPGAFTADLFTYDISDGAGGSLTARANITLGSIQALWRNAYYGSPANSGAGADAALGANGLPNLQSFAFDLDPTAAAGTLDVDTVGGTITTLGPPVVWVDPADNHIYLRFTRRADFAAIPLTIDAQFSSQALTSFGNSAVAPTVIGTGTGDSGVAIEALQVEFPLSLQAPHPDAGRKGRYGRVNVTN